jgi:hypothetical protein
MSQAKHMHCQRPSKPRTGTADDAAPDGAKIFVGLGYYKYVAPTELPVDPFNMSKNIRLRPVKRDYAGQVNTLVHYARILAHNVVRR